MTIRYKFNKNDCIKLADVDYVFKSDSDESIWLRQVDNPDITREVKHSDLPELFSRPDTKWLRGYFSEANEIKRNRNDCEYLNSIDPKKREEAFWKESWCKAFIQAHERGEIKTTDVEIASKIYILEEQVNIIEDVNQAKRSRKLSGLEIVRRHPPSPSCLRKWVRQYQNAGYSAIGLLRKKRSDASYSTIHSNESIELLSECVRGYLDRNRPTKTMILNDTLERFKNVNLRKIKDGKITLRVPSERTVFRAFKNLDPYETVLQREGLAAARQKFNFYETGISSDFPLERVEMDEWRLDIASFIDTSSLADCLTREQRTRFEVGRRWAYFAIDHSTRCVLGFRLVDTPNATDAIRTLQMVFQDKTPIAKAANCESEWSQFGGVSTLVTDQGSAFTSNEFRTAVTDLGFTYEAPPAGVPKLRSTIERLFKTHSIQLASRIIGRTFSNSVEKGDYPTQEWASLTDDELANIFITFIVDIYHNSPHAGLAGETPANAWKRKVAEYWVSPTPDANMQRVVFGTKHNRIIGTHGIRFLGINYTCPALQKALLRTRQKEVTISVDSLDLTHVSVLIGKHYHVATAMLDEVHGLSVEAWKSIIFKLRTKHKNEAEITADIVSAAILRIKDIDENARQIMRVQPLQLTAESVERAERELFLGLEITPYKTSEPTIKHGTQGLLGDVIEPVEITHDDEEKDLLKEPKSNDPWELSDD